MAREEFGERARHRRWMLHVQEMGDALESATLEPWTVENGLLTPTMKLRRNRVMDKFQAELDQMYAGH